MKLLDVKLVDHKSVVAYVTVEIPEWNLQIREVGLFKQNENRWIKLPQKVVEKDGQKKYYPYMRWSTPEVAKRFEAAVWNEFDKLKTAQKQPEAVEWI